MRRRSRLRSGLWILKFPTLFCFHMGSYLEHVTGDDPGKRDSLMKGLDVFLERERDRELFDLAPHKENADGNPGWNPLPEHSFKP